MALIATAPERKMTARYEIIDVKQNTPEWDEARRGMPTSSRFKDLLAVGEGKMRNKYLYQLAAEQITEKTTKTYSNEQMEGGHEHEPWLRDKYCFDSDVDVELVGFVRMNPELCFTGCSPDGLVGEHGMVEFKWMNQTGFAELLDTGKMPTVHQAQMQGGMWIMERRWCDLVIGNPDMKRIRIFRVTRDEQFIGRLVNEVRYFNIELKRLVDRIQDM